MNILRVKKSSLNGSLIPPPSKSHTLRAILFASMAKGKSLISNYLESPDTLAMIQAMKQFGAKIEKQKNTLVIEGVSGKPHSSLDVIDAGNSGQVLRFAGAISALLPTSTTITGDHSIRTNRPVTPLLEGLKGLGAFAISSDIAPIIVRGPISPGVTSLDGKDSQPVSALLIASSFLCGKSIINVTNPGEKPWINLTLDWLKNLGTEITNNNYLKYEVPGNLSYNGFEKLIPGDFSSAAYSIAAAVITNSEITIKNMDVTDPQGDKEFINVLAKMGAKIDISKDQITVLKDGKLHGIRVDINDFIDMVTILPVVACFAEGETEIYNAEIARRKECDRLAAITSELRKMGADIEERPDSLIIRPSKLKGANLETYNDHRMCLALCVASLGATGESHIQNCACLTKSYSSFVQDFQKIGAQIE